MKFSVDKAIFEKWPEVRIGVLVFEGLNNAGHNERILKLLREQEKKEKASLADVDDFGSLPEVASWREVYRAFGSNPHEFRSSVEALLRRAKNGKPLPQINNLVDLYNFLSIKHHLPAGAEDMDKVTGDISLTFAQGDEKGKYLGSDEVDTCYPREVIYKDEVGFICRRWNWREAERTDIEEDTKNAILVLEAIPPVPENQPNVALEEAKALISKYLGGKIQKFILTKENPSLEIDFRTGSKAKEAEFSERELSRLQQEKQPEKKEISVKKSVYHEGTIAYDLAKRIQAAVKTAFPQTEVNLEDILLEHPGAEEHGDYSTNIALRLGQKVGLKPFEVAKAIANLIPGAEVAGPGFINFRLTQEQLVQQVEQVLQKKDKYGQNSEMAGKEVVTEFTDPNPFKEFHIGHLYSNSVGEAIYRLLKAQGASVHRVTYQGDVGLHVAKSIWGMKRLERQMPDESSSLENKAAFLGQAYAFGARAYDEDVEAKEEITELNKKIYEKDPSILELYQKGKSWSLDYFQHFYDLLGSNFEKNYFESEAGELGLEYVRNGLATGIFEKSDGAVVFRGEQYGLHTRVFINSQGLPTYEAKELGLAPAKYNDFKYDLSIIITGNEINEYFKVLLTVLKLINPALEAKTVHLSHGMVRLPTGKMSSRTGKVITAGYLIDEVQNKFRSKLDEKVRARGQGEPADWSVFAKVSPHEMGDISKSVAIGAIKYSFLKNGIGGDIAFDIDKSLDFEGDSGPYLQYTYVRAKSVLRKAGTIEDRKLKMGVEDRELKLENEELAILRYLYRFPEIVEAAARTYSPNLVAGYLFELAKRFNNFYNNVPVLQAESPDQVSFRLALTEASSIVLKNGLNLLGIEALEKM